MTLQSGLFVGFLLALQGCALPPERPVRPDRMERPERPAPVVTVAPRVALAEPGSLAFLTELARVSSLSTEQRRRELAEIEGSRLDDAKRFQLAVLLEREDSVDALERGLKNLALISEADPRSHALIDLMKKAFRARIEQKQLAIRAAELQEKLDQIKALEKSLQQRNSPLKTP